MLMLAETFVSLQDKRTQDSRIRVILPNIFHRNSINFIQSLAELSKLRFIDISKFRKIHELTYINSMIIRILSIVP
jgi:hypothetical protein